MLIFLHKQATTRPKIRAAIQASTEPAWQVAERYGFSKQTVWKWRRGGDTGRMALRKKLQRAQVLEFFSQLRHPQGSGH